MLTAADPSRYAAGYAVQDRFVVKLSKKRVDELVSTGKGERFDLGHGKITKEWFVARKGNANWVELAKEAYAFVRDLDKARTQRSA